MKELVILAGDTIDKTVERLLEAREKGESVYCNFNGHRLESDTVTLDSAYKEITGKTKEEYDKHQANWKEKYIKQQEQEQKEAMTKIPNWIERGKKIIYPELYEKWEKCVSKRATDLYHGKEVEDALVLMEEFNNGITMENAIQIFEGQDHSGMTVGIVLDILLNFSPKGTEFMEKISNGKLNDESKKYLEEKKLEFIELEKNSQIGGQIKK